MNVKHAVYRNRGMECMSIYVKEIVHGKQWTPDFRIINRDFSVSQCVHVHGVEHEVETHTRAISRDGTLSETNDGKLFVIEKEYSPLTLQFRYTVRVYAVGF